MGYYSKGHYASEPPAYLQLRGPIDQVTLGQVLQGVRMYRGRYSANGGEVYTFKFDGVLEKDDIALAHYKGGKGFATVVIIDEVTEKFTPEPGVTYNWLVQKLDREALTELPNHDAEVRKEIKRLELQAMMAPLAGMIDFMPVTKTETRRTRRTLKG